MGFFRRQGVRPSDVIESASRNGIFSDLLATEEAVRRILHHFDHTSYLPGDTLAVRGRVSPGPPPFRGALDRPALVLGLHNQRRFLAAYLDHARPALLHAEGDSPSGEEIVGTLLSALRRLTAIAAVAPDGPITPRRGDAAHLRLLKAAAAPSLRDAHYASLLFQRAAGYWRALTTAEMLSRADVAASRWTAASDTNENVFGAARRLTYVDELVRTSLAAHATHSYYEGCFLLGPPPRDLAVAHPFGFKTTGINTDRILFDMLGQRRRDLLAAGLPTAHEAQHDPYEAAFDFSQVCWDWAPRHPLDTEEYPDDDDLRDEETNEVSREAFPKLVYGGRSGGRHSSRASAHFVSLVLNHAVGFYLGWASGGGPLP